MSVCSHRSRRRLGAALVVASFAAAWCGFNGVALGADEPRQRAFGTQGAVGCGEGVRRLERLVIDKPGVYENLLIDGNWTATTLVKIAADNVTLRNCEI